MFLILSKCQANNSYFLFSIDVWKLIFQIISIGLTIFFALYAYRVWTKKQKLLRESNAASNAIKAAIAFRVVVSNSKELIFNIVSVKKEDSDVHAEGSYNNLNDFITFYQKTYEEKYIQLIQELSICDKMWDSGVKKLIQSYGLVFSNLQSILSVLLFKNTSYKDLSKLKSEFDTYFKKLEQIESDSESISKHIL